MEKNIPVKPQTNGERKPALELFQQFLKENKITFVLRRQKVVHSKDNGIFIEPPIIIPMYEDEFKTQQMEQQLKQDKPNLTIKNSGLPN